MEYQIMDLLAMAFDIKMPITIPDPQKIIKNQFGKTYSIPAEVKNNEGVYYPKVTIQTNDSQDAAVSWMGTPVMFPIKFIGEDLDKPYKVYKPSGELEAITMREFVIPAATIVEFSRAKNIVYTDVLGGNGTVKELFGFDDWRIRLRGFCLHDSNRKTAITAQEQKETLMQWDKIAGSIKVEGSLFKEKGIEEIVIERFTIRQIEGKPWLIPFEIDAVSNEPMQLVV